MALVCACRRPSCGCRVIRAHLLPQLYVHWGAVSSGDRPANLRRAQNWCGARSHAATAAAAARSRARLLLLQQQRQDEELRLPQRQLSKCLSHSSWGIQLASGMHAYGLFCCCCCLAVRLACAAAGEDVTVDMENNVLINHTTGKEYALKPLGDVSSSRGAHGSSTEQHSGCCSNSNSSSWAVLQSVHVSAVQPAGRQLLCLL